MYSMLASITLLFPLYISMASDNSNKPRDLLFNVIPEKQIYVELSKNSNFCVCNVVTYLNIETGTSYSCENNHFTGLF